MTFSLSQKSKDNLKGVDERLVKVVELALTLSDVDFSVLEGIRSPARQRMLVAEGKSQTLKSKHLTGHAVDLGAFVNGGISWEKKHYYEISDAMKEASKQLEIPIRWGGDFKSFFDGPHFELV